MVKKGFEEFPAGKRASLLLPDILKRIALSQERKLGDVEKIWQEIVGKQYARLTKVLKVDGDVLYIKITSAPLYALFSMQERERLEREVREKISFLKIKTIVFRR